MKSQKEIYAKFVNTCGTYIPIYSQPWWLDAVCGEEGWDVWLSVSGGTIRAAMPYHYEKRGNYNYITKAPLTQNNGIIFCYPETSSYVTRQSIRERIINEACDYIESMKIDVYEQQFHHSFDNYLPFFWRGYMAIPRYSYTIYTDDCSEEQIWNNVSSKQKSIIKKGQRNGFYSEDIDSIEFYREHEKIYKKQGLECPFSLNLWLRLYDSCVKNGSGKIVCYKDLESNIASLAFIVWDSRSVYLLMGGGIPEYQRLDTYAALLWKCICFAREIGKSFDFEGSMIKRISKAFAEYGGIPMEYYRIRKVFNKDIALMEIEREYN